MAAFQFRILSQRCSYGALICARSDCFSIGNVCHRTGRRMWTGCRGGRRECDPPSRSSTRTTWSRCGTAKRLLYCAHHPPLGSYTGCSLLKNGTNNKRDISTFRLHMNQPFYFNCMTAQYALRKNIFSAKPRPQCLYDKCTCDYLDCSSS